MTTRSVTMGAPFGWLMKALDVGRRNPGALFGGFLLLLLVGLVPSAVQWFGEWVAAPLTGAWYAINALSVLVSLAIMPPLLGSAFRLVHACETGAPARAVDVLAGYRDGPFALRMILLAVAYVGIFLVVTGALYALLPAKELIGQMIGVALSAPAGTPPDFTGLDAPPGGLLLWLLGATAMLLVLGNAYMLSFGQAALAGRPVLAALGDGFAGAFRNLLPFLGFAIAVFFVGLVLMLIAGVVILVVIAVVSAISPALALAVALPLYLALMLGIYVVMFGFYYHGWREIFGATGTPFEPSTPDAIAA